MRLRNIGDLVRMPLPTQWGPEVVRAGSAAARGQAPVSSGMPATGGPGYPAPYFPFGSPNGAEPAPGPGGPIVWNPGEGYGPGGGYNPGVVLPNSILPPELDRRNPLVRDTPFLANKWDAAIAQEAEHWSWIARNGGLKSCCRVPELGAPIWDQPPWEVMPSQGVEYRQIFSLPTANVSPDGGGGYTGLDTILGQWQVPNGYDGVLNQFVCMFTGTGFEDFSGTITWRVRIGARFAKNLGTVINTFGSYQSAFLVPGYSIRLVSGQTVTLLASIATAAPVAGGQVTAGVFGWTYPRR